MSDKRQDDAMLTEEDKINFGEKLKATRENMGLSVQEAATRLHLSSRFITMLENEDLLHSGLPLIYRRGYLRSYCRLLNISDAELAPILQKMDPRPETLEPLPTPSADSMALSFPLENNPYYARLATFFITLALLTSMTTWWYLHANATTPSTEVAFSQPQEPEQALALQNSMMTPLAYENTLNTANKEAPLNTNKSTLEVAANSPQTLQTPAPEAALPPGTTKAPIAPTTLASAATNSTPILSTAKPTASMKQEEADDENADDKE